MFIAFSANIGSFSISFFRAVVDVLIAHPGLTEHTIDMLEAVEHTTGDRSVIVYNKVYKRGEGRGRGSEGKARRERGRRGEGKREGME